MTFGAINEWSTHAGYARLSAIENHPVLSELLGRIMRQETRHVAFYVTQARERLARSQRAGLAGLNLVSRAATGYGIG